MFSLWSAACICNVLADDFLWRLCVFVFSGTEYQGCLDTRPNGWSAVAVAQIQPIRVWLLAADSHVESAAPPLPPPWCVNRSLKMLFVVRVFEVASFILLTCFLTCRCFTCTFASFFFASSRLHSPSLLFRTGYVIPQMRDNGAAPTMTQGPVNFDPLELGTTGEMIPCVCDCFQSLIIGCVASIHCLLVVLSRFVTWFCCCQRVVSCRVCVPSAQFAFRIALQVCIKSQSQCSISPRSIPLS